MVYARAHATTRPTHALLQDLCSRIYVVGPNLIRELQHAAYIVHARGIDVCRIRYTSHATRVVVNQAVSLHVV